MALTPYKRACFQQALMRKVASAPRLVKVADAGGDFLLLQWFLNKQRKAAEARQAQQQKAKEYEQALRESQQRVERQRQSAQKLGEYATWGLGGGGFGGIVGGLIGSDRGNTLAGTALGIPIGTAVGIGAKALYNKLQA